MSEPIVVLGAGGHAKVVIELLRENGWLVVACTDADPTPRTVLGVPVVGDDGKLDDLRREGVGAAFVALGNNRLREKISNRLLESGFAMPSAISRSAAVSHTARIGRGVAIMSGAAINADSIIGDFAIINTQAGVDHDGVIGRSVHIGPGCALAGCVTVGDRSFLGAGCNVIPDIVIGYDAIVGAGSLIIRDIPPQAKAYGSPARIIN